MTDLDAIRARATVATPGPWSWHGHMPPHGVIDLVSSASGMPYVMGFARLGLRNAQPTFAVGRNMERPGWESGFMTPAFELARTDGRCHRPVLGIDNPDAEFIAHARCDVDDLLAEVDRLRETVRRVFRDRRESDKVLAECLAAMPELAHTASERAA